MKLDEITNIDQFKCNDGKYRYIYKILLTETNEYYYGQHTTNDIYDGYMGSGNEIKKYYDLSGFANVEKDYVCFVNSQSELNCKEREYIGTNYENDPLCLNKTPGGFGGWEAVNKFALSTEKRSKSMKTYMNSLSDKEREEHRIKYKEIYKNWLESLSEEEIKEQVQKIKNGLSKFHNKNPGFCAGENNPMFGKTHTEKSRKIMSDKHIGEQNSQYGTMWICNDITKESKKISKTETIPDGWRKGRFQKPNTPEQMKKQFENQIGYKWITNGIEQKQLKKGNELPEGWHYGHLRIIESDETKHNRVIRLKKLSEENIKKYYPMYEVYISEGFKSVVEKFNYKYSMENLVQQFKKYIPEFKPKRGKRRK